MSGKPSQFWFLAATLAGISVYSFWYAFKAWGKNRVLEDTPLSRVRSAAQGYVELSGRGVLPPNATNRAPLTGKSCTWWRYSIQERATTGRSRSWSTIDSGTSTAPFILDDGSGQCLVDPNGAEVFPNANDVWFGEEAWPQGRLPDGKGVLGWMVDKLVASHRYRYAEHRLEHDEHVYAIGAYRSGGLSVEDPDAAIAELLREWKKDQAALLARFDSDHDGIISPTEWQQAREAARRQVLEARAHEVRPPSLSVLADPADGRAFLLTASDGHSLAQRFRRQALAAIGVFVGSAALLTWMLTNV
jgi:E3 Ubiquitin ligase